ncbi:MAG: N-acetylmuramoyl-L-alanine amidase family protein [Clostridia bacterium]|nr:N-acetylmuramoyl-L-alanine amidase family protein [Clostridia bacterium]
MKNFAKILISILILISALPANAAPVKYFYDGKWNTYNIPPVYLEVLGEKIKTAKDDMPPIIFNNSTLVPARTVFEKLGAKVTWDAKKYQVGVVLDNKNIVLTINNKKASVNGETCEMPVPPKIVNNKTMIPVRFVAEALGMKVEWKEKERIVKIGRPDIGVENIKVDTTNENTRITVTADSVIGEYATLEFDNHPRVAVDIKNAVLKWQDKEIAAQGSYTYKVRAGQNNDNPNITRVVADLNSWTAYKVTLSEDKRTLYIDIDERPSEISGIRFSKAEGADFLEIDMKYVRRPAFAAGNAGTIILDFPMSRFKEGMAGISAYGEYVREVQLIQQDASTARVAINTAGMPFFEAGFKEGGLKLNLSNPSSRNISYSTRDCPRLTFGNARIGMNYFNYRYRYDGNRYILSTPSTLLDSFLGRLVINDGSFESIDFSRNINTSTTDIVFNAKAAFNYNVDTVSNNNEFAVNAYPKDDPRFAGRSDDRDIDPRIRNKIIVIDPGHGGHENGATHPANAGANAEVKEKDLNLDISLMLYEMLKNAGITVYMTRTDDSYVSLYDRGDFANKLGASLLISVHNNAGNSWESGSMTLFYPAVYNSEYGISGERLAQIIQEEMLKGLGTNDRGLWKRPKLAVLNNAKMPSALAEVAYISNLSDRQQLLDKSFRRKAAEALCTAAIKALKELVDAEKFKSQTGGSQAGQSRTPDILPANIGGFSIPSTDAAKCNYRGIGYARSSLFDLTIELDYAKQVSGMASLEEQRNEARQVLLSRLEENSVNKIMEVISQLKDFDSLFWEDELESKEYYIWVRCLRHSGKAVIDLRKKG